MKKQAKQAACTAAPLTFSLTLDELFDRGTETFYDCLGIAAIVLAAGFLLLAIAAILKQCRKWNRGGSRNRRELVENGTEKARRSRDSRITIRQGRIETVREAKRHDAKTGKSRRRMDSKAPKRHTRKHR